MKKRLLSTLLALCMVLALLPGTALAVTVASGKCGENATWSLDSGGNLTLAGTGAMYDYSYSGSPWYARRGDIVRINVGNGITSVGDYAFNNCSNLTSATIGSGVITIKEDAFRECGNLASISLSATLTTIEGAFSYCDHLRTIQYGGSENQWNNISINSTNYPYLYASGSMIHYAGSPNTSSIVSGRCGNNITWSLDSSGNLSLTGTGAMYDYSYSGSPWYARRGDIVRINVGNGITSVGDYAFNNCSNLTSATIGSGVITIKEDAFRECGNLASIYLPASLGTIEYAFSYCNRLKSIYYAGTESEWNSISINSSNNKFLFATDGRVYYNYQVPSSGTYTVTLNVNSGILPAGASRTKTVTNGSTYGSLPTPTRTGYTFLGWYTGVSSGTRVLPTTKVNLTANQTLYARWSKNSTVKTYTIKLDANSGKVSPSSIKVESGQTYLDKLPTPTREGYRFDGWYTTRTGTTKITASTKATASRTVYAHWSRGRSYLMVTFDPNGGTVYQDMKMVIAGNSYRELPTPTRPNYIFKGWYTARSGGKKVTATTRSSASASAQTLYAQWQASATAKTVTGRWTVSVPPYFELPLYASAATAKISSMAAEKGVYQDISCTRKATLSTGAVRYYGTVDGKSRWFTYSCEMDVR